MEQMNSNNNKFYKGNNLVSFYDETDEAIIAVFDNVKQICIFKNKEITATNLNLISVEINRAIKRDGCTTRMLDGTLMHIHLIPIEEED